MLLLNLHRMDIKFMSLPRTMIKIDALRRPYLVFFSTSVLIFAITGTFPVTVYGAFLRRHIFYRFHALCAYLRCLYVALCVLVMWPMFDVILADQVSVVVPLLKLRKSSKVLFYCHFPDLLLAPHNYSEEDIQKAHRLHRRNDNWNGRYDTC